MADLPHVTYQPRPYSRTAVPSRATLHGIQRFTAGYTPALSRQVAAAGGFDRWFRRQLADGYDDDWYATTGRWWPSIHADVATIVRRNNDGTEPLWRADFNYQCWSLVRRVGSQRQVRETMADFWEHHFHVPARGEVGPFRAAYGKAVRSLALGSFSALLQMAVTHPAMSMFLGNANSTKSAPNENLGREVLELHTVGRGQFDEDDVKASARILTGYRIAWWADWSADYDRDSHWTGPVKVMGFEHENAQLDGRPVVKAYLDYLAHHPATARRIARKLAIRFVSDNPSDALVERLASVYLANGTQIRPVLLALVRSTEFKTSAGRKLRTPPEDVVATWRALGARMTAGPRTSSDDSGATTILWQSGVMGLFPFGWQQPDGRPDQARDWSSSSRFLASLSVHHSMAGASWPVDRTSYVKPVDWLPTPRIRFDQLVDHIARRVHGQPSSGLLLQVACEATGLRPGTVITRQHGLVRSDFARLLTVFLDNPTHMSR